MYARKCEKCGAYLDPGERCECMEEKEQEKLIAIDFEHKLTKYTMEEKNGQLKLAI